MDGTLTFTTTFHGPQNNPSLNPIVSPVELFLLKLDIYHLIVVNSWQSQANKGSNQQPQIPRFRVDRTTIAEFVSDKLFPLSTSARPRWLLTFGLGSLVDFHQLDVGVVGWLGGIDGKMQSDMCLSIFHQ